MTDLKFEYGIIKYKHRFSINRPLDDYKETTLNKCVRTSLELKYKTMAKNKLIYELQILYKDENNKPQCICLDLHDYTIKIIKKGDMQTNI